MMCDKNQRIDKLEQVLREMVAHNRRYLKTHVQNRLRLTMLTKQAEKLLGGNDEVRNTEPCRHSAKNAKRD
jgi:hypothetical protein